jgi:aspartyl aminopeptidase
MLQSLQHQKFEILDESFPWELKPGGRYVVIRNGSTLAAFILPTHAIERAQIVASHTDSPSFKLKPNPEFLKEDMLLLGTEIYGGPLLSSWLNRDLGIAGRVVYQDAHRKILEGLVDLRSHPVVIPQLAIHLDRQVNENGLILNKQEHLAALASLDGKEGFLNSLIKEQIPALKKLISHDLFLYPLEPASFIGKNHEMIASYRIDSLASVHAIFKALLTQMKPSKHYLKMAIFWNHEEIGSETAQGASSPFLSHLLERIALSIGMDRESYLCLLHRSLCLSVDLAHALHPNYPDKHEPRHKIFMNKGIVIKFNAQNRYASDGRTAGLIAHLCDHIKLPYQEFVSRNDIPSGSTIGPLNAYRTGIPTVDIGMAQLSMHSSRELMGCQDYRDMIKLIETFYATNTEPAAS